MLVQTLPNILFIDIETVSESVNYPTLDEEWQVLWQQKAGYWLRDIEKPSAENYAEAYLERAGIFAEFGKIVCISLGIIVLENNEVHSFRLNSIYGDDELKILQEFSNLLDKFYPDPDRYYICGHNIREFDVPYIARRLIIKELPLPKMLNISGKKPWETRFILDTLEMWKFGDYKNYTSLKLLAKVLGIPSPKDDIDGSQVGAVYWKEKDVERIKIYCEKDVLTTAQVFLRLQNLPGIPDDKVIFTD